ncbi:hypothetical protein [Melghirimyces algeriensis]|uniref:Uncharacterized protein n=1 Tax=Melghirimyces algeriensis TaxID=910412 RepID=A0A521C6A8_9BACL|nr:hypothetical protein [Melghirimyces algeriensis]SMO54986.1 hypothetical protein SAMN06264849_103150 [Melghirimyces algeriensis]
MYTGKVTKRFIDKYTQKRFEVGQEYNHKEEKRLKELSEQGFVEYETEKKTEKKTKEKSKK